jgi:hypothetical protein
LITWSRSRKERGSAEEEVTGKRPDYGYFDHVNLSAPVLHPCQSLEHPDYVLFLEFIVVLRPVKRR